MAWQGTCLVWRGASKKEWGVGKVAEAWWALIAMEAKPELDSWSSWSQVGVLLGLPQTIPGESKPGRQVDGCSVKVDCRPASALDSLSGLQEAF